MSAPIVLLEEKDTRNRLRQQAVPLAGAILVITGMAILALRDESSKLTGGLMLAGGVALMLASPQLLVAWDVTYKGHAIRFENSVVFGERLIIDEERFSAGVLGYRKTLIGTLRTGQGIGDRIRAESVAGIVQFEIRIVAEEASSGAGTGAGA